MGLDFTSEIEKTLQTIRAFPERWPLREDGSRRCLIHRFPYLLIYTYFADHLWIIAVAHTKRRPDYWQERLDATDPSDET